MLLVLSIVCVVSDSSLEIVLACDMPLPPRSRTDGVVIGWMALKVCGLFVVVLVVVDSYRNTNLGTSLVLSSFLSLS